MSQHATNNEETTGTEPVSKTSSRSSFWLIIILVFLFVAALNFVEVMGHSEEGEKGKTEMVEPQKEATANETLKGETGTGKVEEKKNDAEGTTPAATADSSAAKH